MPQTLEEIEYVDTFYVAHTTVYRVERYYDSTTFRIFFAKGFQPFKVARKHFFY